MNRGMSPRKIFGIGDTPDWSAMAKGKGVGAFGITTKLGGKGKMTSGGDFGISTRLGRSGNTSVGTGDFGISPMLGGVGERGMSSGRTKSILSDDQRCCPSPRGGKQMNGRH